MKEDAFHVCAAWILEGRQRHTWGCVLGKTWESLSYTGRGWRQHKASVEQSGEMMGRGQYKEIWKGDCKTEGTRGGKESENLREEQKSIASVKWEEGKKGKSYYTAFCPQIQK